MMDATTRARLVLRHTIRLTVAQVLLWVVLGIWARLVTVQIDELTGSPALAGAAVAIYYVAAGVGARATGWRMDRSGRRVGLLIAYAVLAIGGLSSFTSAAIRSPTSLLIATAMIGLGSGGALLGRAAVADMYPPIERGRAVGRVVVAGALGAIAGPFLASAIADPAGPAVPWLLIPILCSAAIAVLWGIRPDPRELAPAVAGPPAGETSSGTGVLTSRRGVAAAVAIGVSQAVMATFMAIVPVVLNRGHAGHGAVSLVVSLHLGAMFAFSPPIGAFLDRAGRKPGLLLGLGLTGSGVGLCAFVPGTASSAAGLLLIGVGWSAAYLGSTALVSDLATPSGRARALGTTDLVASISAAAGVLAGGRLLESAGIDALGSAGLALMLAPALLVGSLRRPATARA